MLPDAQTLGATFPWCADWSDELKALFHAYVVAKQRNNVLDYDDLLLLDEDYLILSTIHSAKGQEWDAVFILNVADGCIPSDMAAGSPVSP